MGFPLGRYHGFPLGRYHGLSTRYVCNSWLEIKNTLKLTVIEGYLRPKEKICVFPVTSPKKLG